MASEQIPATLLESHEFIAELNLGGPTSSRARRAALCAKSVDRQTYLGTA